MFWVHVIESRCKRFASYARRGPHHVGISEDPATALMRINGELGGGSSFFVSLRPWKPRALYGPFQTWEEADKAARDIKKLKREERAAWNEEGSKHPWVFNPLLRPRQF